MKEILIFSAGPAGRETFQLINEINKKRKQWKVVGYVDDEIEKKLNYLDKIKVFSNKNKPSGNRLYAITGIMEPKIRLKIYTEEVMKINYFLDDYKMTLQNIDFRSSARVFVWLFDRVGVWVCG